MKIHNLYSDTEGNSHWRTVEIEYPGASQGSRLAKPIAVKSLIFREVPPAYDLDWHNAPTRQYIVNLDNGVQITASDGEVRTIGAGEVFLVEDVSGKGHLSKAVNDRVRNSLFITLE